MTEPLISDPVWVPRLGQCSKLSCYAISRKTNRPNLILGLILTDLTQICATNLFFFANFTSSNNYTLFQAIIQCNYKGKLMNQTWKNKKNPNFGPNFDLFGPNLVQQNFFESFTSTSSWLLFQPIIQCNLKEN